MLQHRIDHSHMPQAHSRLPQASIAFVEAYATALQQAGTPAHRLEAAVDHAASALGVDAACSATPTGLFLAMPEGTRLLRVGAGGGDLGFLVALDGIGTEVGAGTLDAASALDAVRALEGQAPRYSPALELLAHGVLAAGAAALFGGGPLEAAVAAALGIVGAQLVERFGRLGPMASAALATSVATAVGASTSLDIPTVSVAAIIILLPGFSLTTGIGELATGHLTAGTSRLAGALVDFLMQGLGAMLGLRLAAGLGLVPLAAPLPFDWPEPVVVLTASLALVILLRARPRDAGLVVAASFLGWGAATLLSPMLGPQTGAAAGAFAVALAGNAVGRWLRLPATLLVAPSLLLLVPGSLGFRGVGALLDTNTLVGMQAAVEMFVVAGGLVGGLLLANLVLSPQRDL